METSVQLVVAALMVQGDSARAWSEEQQFTVAPGWPWRPEDACSGNRHTYGINRRMVYA